MTVSPDFHKMLEFVRDALAEIVAEAPKAEPQPHDYRSGPETWVHDSVSWERAETARPALEKINAALAEMEAQS